MNSNLVFHPALPGKKSPKQFHLKKDKRRKSLDPESGQAI